MRERPESLNTPEQHNTNNNPSRSYDGVPRVIQRIHEVENRDNYQNYYSLQKFLSSLNSSIMP